MGDAIRVADSVLSTLGGALLLGAMAISLGGPLQDGGSSLPFQLTGVGAAAVLCGTMGAALLLASLPLVIADFWGRRHLLSHRYFRGALAEELKGAPEGPK